MSKEGNEAYIRLCKEDGRKFLVEICLIGCDATTEWEEMVTYEDYMFLRLLEKRSKEESTYRCMPTLTVSLVEDREVIDDEN